MSGGAEGGDGLVQGSLRSNSVLSAPQAELPADLQRHRGSRPYPKVTALTQLRPATVHRVRAGKTI